MAKIACLDCGREIEPVEIIPLKDAVLCANCEQITRRTLNGACAACGSFSGLSLESVLDQVGFIPPVSRIPSLESRYGVKAS